MAFMLGAFTNGLASGAKTAMSLYSQYKDLEAKEDLKDTLGKALDENNKRKAGVQPGQATAGVQTGAASLGSYGDGEAMSGSTAAPKPAPDPGADPRKDTGYALSPSQRAALTTAGTLVSRGEHSDNRDTTVAKPGNETLSNPQFEPGKSTSPADMTTYDQPGAPQPSVYNGGASSGSPVFGSKVADWILGRNPQDRAVHLTPTMGVASGPGPSSTPMSTSPGGRPPPQYLPQQNQPPPALASAPTAGAPTLANPRANPLQAIGQAVQTQYGNGGM